MNDGDVEAVSKALREVLKMMADDNIPDRYWEWIDTEWLAREAIAVIRQL